MLHSHIPSSQVVSYPSDHQRGAWLLLTLKLALDCVCWRPQLDIYILKCVNQFNLENSGSSFRAFNSLQPCSSSRSIILRCLQSLFDNEKLFWFQCIFVSVTIVLEFFSCWIPEDPWVKEDGTVEEVVEGVSWPEVKIGLKVQPSFEEAFDAWKSCIDHAG